MGGNLTRIEGSADFWPVGTTSHSFWVLPLKWVPFSIFLSLQSLSSSPSPRRVNSVGQAWIVCLFLDKKDRNLPWFIALPKTAHGGANIIPHDEMRELFSRGNRCEKARKTTHVHYLPLHQGTYTMVLDSVRTYKDIWIFINSLFCYVCGR